MISILPTISMSDLQRRAKEKLLAVQDYAVIQRHGRDIAFVLHPSLGRALLETGMLDMLKSKLALIEGKKSVSQTAASGASSAALPELDRLIGQVLRELSSR